MSQMAGVLPHGLLLASCGWATYMMYQQSWTHLYAAPWFLTATAASLLGVIRNITDRYNWNDVEKKCCWANEALGIPLFVAQVCLTLGIAEASYVCFALAAYAVFVEFSDNSNDWREEILLANILLLGLVTAKANNTIGLAATTSIVFNYFLGPPLARERRLDIENLFLVGSAVSAYLFIRTLSG